MYCLIIIISVKEGGEPQLLVYINHSLTTYVTHYFPSNHVGGWQNGNYTV